MVSPRNAVINLYHGRVYSVELRVRLVLAVRVYKPEFVAHPHNGYPTGKGTGIVELRIDDKVPGPVHVTDFLSVQ